MKRRFHGYGGCLEILRNESESDLIRKILHRFNLSRSYWEPTFHYWRKLLRDYRQELKLARDENGNILYPYRSKVFPPLTFEKMEVIVPLIVDAIFARDPFFTVSRNRGSHNQGDLEKTKILMDWQLRVRNFKSKMEEAIQECVMLGNKIIRMRWCYEAEWFDKRETVFEMGIPVGVDMRRQLEEVYEGPDIDLIPFYRFFIDPRTPPGQLQKAGWMVEEVIKQDWEFKIDAKYLKYENLDKLEDFTFRSNTVKGELDNRKVQSDEYARDVRILLYHDHDQVVHLAVSPGAASSGVILKRQELAEVQPNLKFPYYVLQSRMNVDDGEESSGDMDADYHPSSFYSMGSIHPIHGLQMMQATMFNQRADSIALSMNPPLFAISSALEDEEELGNGYRPGQIIHIMEDMGIPAREAVFPLQFQDSFGPGYTRQFETILMLADRALGAEATVAGYQDPTNTTATGIMQKTANAMKRFGRSVGVIAGRGIEPILNDWSDMNARFMDADTMAYVTGSPDVVYIGPEDIVRGCNFSIRVMPFYYRQLLSDSLIKLLPVLTKLMPFMNLTAAVRTILENQEGVENVDDLLPPILPPITPFMLSQLEALMQIQAAVQQQQMGQQQAGQRQDMQGMENGQKIPGVAGAGGAAGNIASDMGRISRGFDSAAEVNAIKSILNQRQR